MSTYTLSIGRRQGHGDNLPRADWIKFQAHVENAIYDFGGTVYFAGRGGGIYEGTYEESATWVFDAEPEPVDERRFERDLGYWARKFGQESIAVTRGETSFVLAAKAHEAA